MITTLVLQIRIDNDATKTKESYEAMNETLQQELVKQQQLQEDAITYETYYNQSYAQFVKAVDNDTDDFDIELLESELSSLQSQQKTLQQQLQILEAQLQ